MSSPALMLPTAPHPFADRPPLAHPVGKLAIGCETTDMGVEKVGDARGRPADAPEPPQKSKLEVAAAAGDATVLGKKRKAMTHYESESKKARNMGWEAGLEYEKLLAGEKLSVWEKWFDGKPFSGIEEERAYRRFSGIQRKVYTWRKTQEEQDAAADAEVAEIAAIDAACDEEASAMEIRLAHGMGALTPLGVGTHTRFDSDTESDEEPVKEPVKKAVKEPKKAAKAPAQLYLSEERAAESELVDLTGDSDSEEELEAAEEAEEAEEAAEEAAKVTRMLSVHRRGKGQTVRVPSIAAEVAAASACAAARKDRKVAKKKSAALRKLMYEVSATWRASQRHV